MCRGFGLKCIDIHKSKKIDSLCDNTRFCRVCKGDKTEKIYNENAIFYEMGGIISTFTPFFQDNCGNLRFSMRFIIN